MSGRTFCRAKALSSTGCNAQQASAAIRMLLQSSAQLPHDVIANLMTVADSLEGAHSTGSDNAAGRRLSLGADSLQGLQTLAAGPNIAPEAGTSTARAAADGDLALHAPVESKKRKSGGGPDGTQAGPPSQNAATPSEPPKKRSKTQQNGNAAEEAQQQPAPQQQAVSNGDVHSTSDHKAAKKAAQKAARKAAKQAAKAAAKEADKAKDTTQEKAGSQHKQASKQAQPPVQPPRQPTSKQKATDMEGMAAASARKQDKKHKKEKKHRSKDT